MNQNQPKPTCQQCFWENFQETPAKHYWEKGLSECHQWLCQPCYRKEQIKWIIYEEKQKQTKAKNLIDYEKSARKYSRKNKEKS